MTETEAPTQTSSMFVSTLLNKANEYSAVKTSLSIARGTYSTVTSYVKPVCPVTVTNHWSSAETYIDENHNNIVKELDSCADAVSDYCVNANNARKESRAVDYLLESVESLVDEKSVDTNASKFSRALSVSSKLSSKLYKKATGTLYSSANTVSDVITPQINKTIAVPGEILSNVTKRVENVAVENVIEPAKSIYKFTKGKSWTDLFRVTSDTVWLNWNDRVVVPLSSHLDVPDLKYSTLKPKFLEYSNEKVDTVKEYGSSTYDEVTAKMSASYGEYIGKDFDLSTFTTDLYTVAKGKVITTSMATAELAMSYVPAGIQAYLPSFVKAKLA